MLPKQYKLILNFIVDQWKNNDGKLVKMHVNDEDYKKLKSLLEERKIKLDDTYLGTAILYLEDIGLIKRPPLVTERRKYVPTLEGLEQNTPWIFRENSYKWYIGVVLTLIGIVVGFLISK